MRTTKQTIIDLDDGDRITVRHKIGKRTIEIRLWAEDCDTIPSLHINTDFAFAIEDNDGRGSDLHPQPDAWPVHIQLMHDDH
jgi:hypothetical protein